MARIFTTIGVLMLGSGLSAGAFAQEGAPQPSAPPVPAAEASSPPAAASAPEAPPAAAPTPDAPPAATPPAATPPSAAPAGGEIRLTQRTSRRARPRSDESESAPPTLFGKKVAIGGYGGVDVAYTRMFGKDGALVGLQGALLLDHRLSIGIAGYGWTNPQDGPDDRYGRPRNYESGYLGAAFRYSFLQSSPVYLTAGALVGSGVVVLAPDDDRDSSDDDEDYDIRREDVDVFAVFQPDLTVNANFTRWMRAGLTVGYRFTAGVGRFGMTEGDLDGVVAGGSLQFGRF